MRLNESSELFFTYGQTRAILKAEGLGHGRANVSYAVKVSETLECVERLGQKMITRDSLKSHIDRVNAWNNSRGAYKIKPKEAK